MDHVLNPLSLTLLGELSKATVFVLENPILTVFKLDVVEKTSGLSN